MSRRAIAIDLGGTLVRAGLVSDRAGVLFHVSQPTRATAGPEAVLAQIADLVAQVRGAGADSSAPIGVSAPGPLDTRAGVVCAVQSLAGFEGYPLRAALEQRLSAPVVLENDGIAGAIGEWRHGAGKGCADLIYVTLSTGIGGGIIAGGRPLRGHRGLAGHLGHMFFTAEGARAPGGHMSCFEDYASATALAHRARVAEGHGQAGCDSRHLVRAARDGDSLAQRLIADEARMVGIGLASLAHLLNPERIVIGGGLMAAFDLLAPGIRQAFLDHAKRGFAATEIERAALQAHSCLIGAATLALDPALSA